jgi:long-chain acyl-CoA synthetase
MSRGICGFQLVAGIEGACEVSSYRDYVLLERDAASIELHPDLALMMTTSGSTGSSKFVRLSYDNLASNALSIAEYLGIREDDRAITTLPMHYVYGLSVINSHLQSGATVILSAGSFMDRRLWGILRTQQVTSISGVPYTYEFLDRLGWNRMEVPSLKTLTQAGGKLSASLVRKFAATCQSRGMRFFVMYGAAEATARMSYLPPELATQKPTSIGVAIPGGELWIENEAGHIVTQSGVIGELCYRGKNVMLGYARCREDLALGDENHGVLRTGDLAKRDEDGWYYIVGRKSRFVKVYGNRVCLDELEQLIRDAGVDCVCTGGDDGLRAYISKSSMQDDVVLYIRSVTKFFEPVLSIVVIDKIPRNEFGKILYSELP